MMKCGFLGAVACGLFLARPAPAAEQCITLGDSLSFAYEASFGFEVVMTFPYSGTVGDNFGPEVKNWIEILHGPAYRNAFFDQGARDEINVRTGWFTSQDLFFRREYNWASPGMKTGQLRRFLNREATARELIAESPAFAPLADALDNSDFQDSDFDVADLEVQIGNSAERLVLFIGGNDINEIYGAVYDGGDPGTFVADFVADATFVIDWVQALNPDIQMVLANVPHVGITPLVKATYPPDTLKTGRVTGLLRELNRQLKALAASRNIGYADVFSGTLPLLTSAPLCVHGIPFANSGSGTADLDFVWLNGELSSNFHPNTSAQAQIANEIIHVFNRKYGTGIAPLTATEILAGLLGKTPAQIDMPFATWMACYGLAGLTTADDSDGDGIPAGVEFALGLDPTVHDSEFVTQGVVENAGTPEWQIAYPLRLPVSARFTLTPAQSTTLGGFTPLSPVPVVGPDGKARASVPVSALSGGAGFLRLQSVVTP